MAAEDRLPPLTQASPAQMRPRDASDIRWYKPSWSEIARLMGWRWLLFLPAVALMALMVMAPLTSIFIFGWKLMVIAVGLPGGYLIRTSRTIIRSRSEPFCIHCGYDLSNLPDNYICPECGEAYSHQIIDEYRRDPHWFIQRYSAHQELPRANAPFHALPSKRRKSRDGT
jgi:hypothetical protein